MPIGPSLFRLFALCGFLAMGRAATSAAHSPNVVVGWGLNAKGQISVPGGLTNAIAVAAGFEHGLALTSDGSVLGWGNNFQGQSAPPPGMSNVIAIVAGWNHSLALHTNGKVTAWGYNAFGQANVPAGLTNVIAIAASGHHSLALKSDGTIVGWGYNAYGQATPPADLSNAVAIAAGARHSLALKSNGTVVGWGDNAAGQLSIPAGLSNVTSIAAGYLFSLAVKQDGAVVGFGNNSHGQLNVPGTTNNFVAVAGGSVHTLAITSEGKPIGWGCASCFGVLPVPANLSHVSAVAAGELFSLALTRAPWITEQPTNRTAVPGDDISFTVAAISAEPLTYQWLFNGVALEGATNAILLLTDVQNTNAGSYTVRVANSVTVAQSAPVTLTILSPPTITLQPQNQSVLAGGTVTFNVEASGTPPIRFQWTFNDANLSGATNSALTLNNVQFANQGMYHVVCGNSVGSVTSAPVTLTVGSPPVIVTQPASQTVLAGSNVTFTVGLTGTLPFSFTWKFNGTTIGGMTNASLNLSNIQSGHAGSYAVVVTNSYGSVISSSAILTVLLPPRILSSPMSQTVPAGTNVVLNVVVAGTTPLHYQWRFNGQTLSGATSPALLLTNVQASSAGNYSVLVSNVAGSVISSLAALQVVPSSPRILSQPAGQIALAGTNLTFSPIVVGSEPLVYQWLFDGLPISGATNMFLLLQNVQPDHAGNYTLMVANDHGSAASAPAALIVEPASPWISVQPQGKVAFENSRVEFSATARGSLPITYQWAFEGVPGPAATNQLLVLTNVAGPNAGNYQLIASNAYGSATSAPAVLTVIGPPAGQLDWPVVSVTEVSSGFSRPTHINHAGDNSGRLFIVEQSGLIRILSGTGIQPVPFLDISDRVLAPEDSEQGLLSVCFPPGYAAKRHFYVNYTRQPDGATVVSRFFLTADTNIADAANEQIVLTVPQPFPTHNGGQLAFGPDGFLYIGMGDGGDHGDPNNLAQSPSSLLGKLLRIDVESSLDAYQIPPDNPYINTPPFGPEIWALGLRNPWRFSFDRFTGDLFIADVGEASWEEINYQPASTPGGRNYGWRIREGNRDFNLPPAFDTNGLTAPIFVYPHTGPGTAVTGGHVFRGPGSTRMLGLYLYADFGSGRISALARNGSNWHSRELVDTSFLTSTFGEDDAGRIYTADYLAGKIHLIEDSGKAIPPTLSPGSSVFPSESLVTVATLSPGAIVRYTTDGRDPVETDPGVLSGTSLIIGSTLTLKVRTFRPDLLPSDVTSADYTMRVAIPVFSPAAGPITNGTPIAIDCATPGAEIHYTIDGTDPGPASSLYSSPVPLNANSTLKARAYRTSFNDSPIASVFYTLVAYEDSIVTTLAGDGIAGFRDASGTSAQFSFPQGIAIDPSGNLLVADTGNHRIRKITPGGVVTTLAGSGVPGAQDGPAASARFSSPIGICLDRAGNIYTTDSGSDSIRKLDSSGYVTTLPPAGFNLRFLDADAEDNLFVCGWALIRKMTPAGSVSAFAGTGISGLAGWSPNLGSAIDASGHLLAASAQGFIFRISPDGTQELYAGAGTGFADGPRLSSRFTNPIDATADRLGNVYVSDGPSFFDQSGHRVRKIHPSGQVTTMAGNGRPGFQDGPGPSAQFSDPSGLCVDLNGHLYLADTANNRIRRIAPLDWDRDGIPDSREAGASVYVIGIDDRFVDSDNDGQSNTAEFLAGTDPGDPASFLAILAPSINNHQFSFSWQSVVEKMYQIEVSEDLSNWQNSGDPVLGNGSLMFFGHSTADPPPSQRFYRISVAAP
jgi:glucose/arabinose dehydrogenase/alpha-tubulin suppressor-like RCC1 family protein/sugar lactone lactonase YvrE